MKKELVAFALCIMIASPTLAFAVSPSPQSEPSDKDAGLNRLGGLRNPQGPKESETTHVISPREILSTAPSERPSYIDNSAGLPPVGDQRSLGSCTCWAIGYYHTTFIENKESPFNLSDPNNQASPLFLYAIANGGYDGGSFMEDVADLIITNGVPSMAEHPYSSDYSSWPDEDWVWVSGMKRRAASQNWIDLSQPGGMDAIRAYIAAGNTATFGIDVWGNFDEIENYNYTYCSSERTGYNRGGHIVTIVGYDDDKPTADGIGAFRMVNSWGTSWGEAGFWWMSYEAMVDGYLGYSWAMYLESEPAGYAPKLVAKAQVTHPLRGDIVKGYGLEFSIWKNMTMLDAKPFLGCYWIEDWYASQSDPIQTHPFPNGRMAFDLTEIMQFMAPQDQLEYWLMLDNQGGIPGELVSYEVLNAEWWVGGIGEGVPMSIEGSIDNYAGTYTAPGVFVHYPIRVDGDAGLAHAKIGEFLPGDGTPADPYVLHDYIIDGTGLGNCIYVGNTTEAFTVRNCNLWGASSSEWSDYHGDSSVLLYSVTGGEVLDNVLSSSFLGAYLVECDGTLVEGNEVMYNTFGMDLPFCTGVTVRQNNITDNIEYGICIDVTEGNVVYHNNIIGNAVQAYDDTGLNSWDSGYPIGGNYWSDYLGSDIFTGPGQDVPGTDGIGDVPYISITGGMGAQDNYPLMEPWTLESGQASHTPIRINSNSDFDAAHGVVNWDTGNGTAWNPWVIEGWTINGVDEHFCIYVGNATEHFVIRGCELFGCDGYGSGWPYAGDIGITLFNSSNGIIANNSVHDNWRGIYIYNGSTDNVVEGNTVDNHANGIQVSTRSHSNRISDNRISDSSTFGLIWYLSDNVLAKDNTVINNSYWGVYIAESIGSRLEGCTVMNSTGIGIYVADSSNVIVSGCSVLDAATGIDVGNSTGVSMEGCVAQGAEVGLYILPTSAGNSFMNMSLSDNNISVQLDSASNTLEGFDISDSNVALQMNGASQNRISNCTVTGSAVGCSMSASFNNTIEYCSFDRCSYGILVAAASDDNTVRGCTVSNTTGAVASQASAFSCETGLEVYQNDAVWSHYVSFEEQLAIGAGGNPMFTRAVPLQNCTVFSVVIEGNRADVVDLDLAVFLDGKDGYPVDGMTQAEEIVAYSATFEPDEALVFSFPVDGTYLVRVFGFDVLGNPGHFNMTLSMLSLNSTGIIISAGDGNAVYHNSFLNNLNQAFDDTGLNDWDDGYPSGGNYWSDYTGIDILSGPAQDLPGSDGIGDVPYASIAGGTGAQDNYPLMEPYTPIVPGVFSVNLSAGWNLISIPLVMADTSVESVLASISGDWDVAKAYDTLDAMDPWKSYRPGGTVNDLASIDNTIGFWVHATAACTLTVEGAEPASTVMTLHTGWNLIGYPSETTRIIAEALWGTSADRVEAFDAASPYLVSELRADEAMAPGSGYWVHVVADSVWTVDW